MLRMPACRRQAVLRFRFAMSHMTLNLTCYVIKSLGRAAYEVTIDRRLSKVLALTVWRLSVGYEIGEVLWKYFANTVAFENTEALLFC